MKGTRSLLSDKKLRIEGDFRKAVWDDYKIVVHPVADYAKRMRGRRIFNIDHPGESSAPTLVRRSRFNDVPREDNPFDVSALRGDRATLVVDTGDLDLFRPRLFWLLGKGGSDLADRAPGKGASPVPLKHGSGVHFAGVRMGGRYALALGDGALLRDDAELLPTVEGRLLQVRPKSPARPVTVTIRSTPTLAAFGRIVTIARIVSNEPALRWHDDCRPAERIATDVHRIRTFHRVEDLDRDAKIHVSFGGQDTSGLRLSNGRLGGAWNGGRVFTFSSTKRTRAALGAGTLDLDVAGRKRMLILRAVGPNGEGLPWVEASLVAEDDDPVAQRMLEVARGIAKDGRRNALERGWVHGLGNYSPAEDLADTAVVEALGNETSAAFPTRDMRLRLYREGAWYSTRRRATSDVHGYIVYPGAHLSPGRRYVLYLWSRSRNDLQPDGRIVFQTARGVTDLGVVRLPTP